MYWRTMFVALFTPVDCFVHSLLHPLSCVQWLWTRLHSSLCVQWSECFSNTTLYYSIPFVLIVLPAVWYGFQCFLWQLNLPALLISSLGTLRRFQLDLKGSLHISMCKGLSECYLVSKIHGMLEFLLALKVIIPEFLAWAVPFVKFASKTQLTLK